MSAVVPALTNMYDGTPFMNEPHSQLEQLKLSSFCAYPFVQISTIPAGFFRPCCYYTKMLQAPTGRNFSVATDTIEKVWNSESLRMIRRKMLSGEALHQCRQCYQEEASGSTSMRQRSLQDWGDHEGLAKAIIEAEANDYQLSSLPYFLELKPGNLCNLKCRMCNQFDSSSVANELKTLANKYSHLISLKDPRLFDKETFEVDFTVDQMPNWSAIPEFWAEIASFIPYIETLSFAGGEPTLLPEVFSLLKACVDSGHSKRIRVFLSSNFTYLSNDLIEVSTQFNPFEFIASIDGTGSVQEYIRFPSKWNVVAENFLLVKERVKEGRVKLLVNLTLQMYNVLSFTDVLDWIETLALEQPHFYQYPYSINILFKPRFLNIDILPLSLREIAIERINAYLKRSHLIKNLEGLGDRFDLILHQLKQPLPPDYEDNLKKFWAYTQLLDDHRKQKLKHVDPILYAGVATEAARLGFENWNFSKSQLKNEPIASSVGEHNP